MSVKIKPITFGTENTGIETARKKALQLILVPTLPRGNAQGVK